MNGRVYDTTIGRFLSADPNIFHPFDTQNYNRYSYVQNNPLEYTDPSGYDLESESESSFVDDIFDTIERFFDSWNELNEKYVSNSKKDSKNLEIAEASIAGLKKV